MKAYCALGLAFLLVGIAQAQDLHVVRPGETLWNISRQHLATPLRWPELQRDNAVPVPQQLKPGQVLRLHGSAAGSAVAMAVVAELVGAAWLKRGNDAPRALIAGTKLQVNDVLVTDHDAFLGLKLADGSRLVMPSSSAVQVLVVNGRTTRFQLLNGRVEAHVEKQHGREFEIRSRSAKLGVRGTHFRVRDEDDVAAAEVIEGVVAVSINGREALVLGAARGALLEGTNALKSRPLLTPPQRGSDTVWGGVTAAPIPEAQRYRLQLARDERFLQIVYEASSTNGEFTLPTDLDAGFYHLRLTAFDAQQLEGLPGDSTAWVRGSPPRSGIQRLSDGRYEIRWPARPGQHFAFELASDPAFAPLLASEPDVSGGSVIVGPFESPGLYHWRSHELVPDSETAGAANEGSFDVPASAARKP
ncbi:MAG: FecR domain-containing protein [Moraxellaceae bacterium]|nr:FecR domain-containing protein [Moraxellaceae bacterium]